MTYPTSTTDITIMKTDKLGRIHATPEQREAWLDAFEQSGMSGAAFAKLHGIKYTTFAHWRQKRKHGRRPDVAEPTPFFEEVQVHAGPPEPAALKITLPGGASVQMNRAEQFPMVAALLKYLEHSC
jgi:hypothetical protein